MKYKEYREYSENHTTAYSEVDYWKYLESIEPKYASGIDVQICDADLKILNLGKMDSILQTTLDKLGPTGSNSTPQIAGVSTPYRYSFK